MRERPRNVWLVPDLTSLQKRAADRLAGLEALSSGLSADERNQFRSYMLGWLAATASEEDWEAALFGAMESSNTWLKHAQNRGDSDKGNEPLS